LISTLTQPNPSSAVAKRDFASFAMKLSTASDDRFTLKNQRFEYRLNDTGLRHLSDIYYVALEHKDGCTTTQNRCTSNQKYLCCTTTQVMHFNSRNVALEHKDGCTTTQGLMHFKARNVALRINGVAGKPLKKKELIAISVC
jgi:hypothetical protein